MKIPKNITTAATRATILKRQIADLTIELEACKEVIRPWAIEIYDEDKEEGQITTSLEVPTNEGTLMVIFPKDSPKVIDGKNLETITEIMPIPISRFAVIQAWKFHKDFYSHWKTSEEDKGPFKQSELKLMLSIIEWNRATPRVEPAK